MNEKRSGEKKEKKRNSQIKEEEQVYENNNERLFEFGINSYSRKRVITAS